VAQPLVYVDISDVRAGALAELKGAIGELAEFIEANVDSVLAYSVHLSDDGTEMRVVHFHPDAASLERHLEIGGLVFRKFADLVTLRVIHVYGEPSEQAVERLQAKARDLGSGEVVVHSPAASFSRLAPSATRD
jgi:hypothetical protein